MKQNSFQTIIVDLILSLINYGMKEKTTKNNLSYKQKQAIKNLQENENIIIKEADKGSAVVIIGKTYYRTIIKKILNDELLDANIDSKIISKITKFYRIHNKSVTKKEKDFSTDYIPQTSNFYGLLKVHKSEEIQKAIET